MNEAHVMGLVAAAVAFVAALLLVPTMRVVALKGGVTDKPGGRKLQRAPVPLLGGVGVTLAAVAGVLLAAKLRLDYVPSPVGTTRVLVAGGLMFAIGLVDDLFKDRVGPLPKFVAQFVAVVILFLPSYTKLVAGEFGPGNTFYLFATTLWFLTVVNAVNFVDNMNGLCSGLGMISLLVGLFGLTGATDVRYTLMAGGLGGALLGFLPWNYPKARIYLGDTGSHVAGFFLALLSLEFTGGFMGTGSRLLGLDAFVPAMLVLGVPLFDLLFSVVRRHRERRPIFHGDARHLSHRLVGAGLDPASAVMLLWGVHLILTAWGVVAVGMSAPARYAIVAVVLLFLAVLSAILVRIERARGRPAAAVAREETPSGSANGAAVGGGDPSVVRSGRRASRS